MLKNKIFFFSFVLILIGFSSFAQEQDNVEGYLEHLYLDLGTVVIDKKNYQLGPGYVVVKDENPTIEISLSRDLIKKWVQLEFKKNQESLPLVEKIIVYDE